MPTDIVIMKQDSIPIPSEIRKEADIEKKDKVLVFNENGFIVGMKIPKNEGRAIEKVIKFMHRNDKKMDELETMLKKLKITLKTVKNE